MSNKELAPKKDTPTKEQINNFSIDIALRDIYSENFDGEGEGVHVLGVVGKR